MQAHCQARTALGPKRHADGSSQRKESQGLDPPASFCPTAPTWAKTRC